MQVQTSSLRWNPWKSWILTEFRCNRPSKKRKQTEFSDDFFRKISNSERCLFGEWGVESGRKSDEVRFHQFLLRRCRFAQRRVPVRLSDRGSECLFFYYQS